mmetsp:Transcript_30510/g.91635  ORF Transcript_30510/g.91635 Transcript_30510/m.91635 type:complete len:162 (+) Transcript_30510:105-590(+)
MPDGSDDGRWERPLRSKGLLPALGVGGVVYLVTGAVSMGTLAMVGIGAGVGYGVGSWLADAYQKKQGGGAQQPGMSMEQLPHGMQVSLQTWQTFLASRVSGGQLNPPEVERLFAEFEQREPGHAHNVRSIVHAAGAGSGSGGTPVVQQGGATIVPTLAAEV